MRVDIVTIFPDMFRDVFGHGIVGRAHQAGLAAVETHDLRQWTTDKHRSTDDAPYGGGPGMVMKVEPLVAAVEDLVSRSDASPDRRSTVLMSPRGVPLNQSRVETMSKLEHLILVAGRYEGVDERFLLATGASELSIGDYVLSGGEIPAMVVVDALTRLLPGALSDPRSAANDSFSDDQLDFPHYTRPAVFRDFHVPEVLLSGNHAAVRQWREQRALEDTRRRRPELLDADSVHISRS